MVTRDDPKYYDKKRCNKPFYAKWYPTKTAAIATKNRLKSSGKSVKLLDDFCAGVAGYRSGWILASKKQIRGWKHIK